MVPGHSGIMRAMHSLSLMAAVWMAAGPVARAADELDAGADIVLEEQSAWRNPCFSPGKREDALGAAFAFGSREGMDDAWGARAATSWFFPSGFGLTAAASVLSDGDTAGTVEAMGVWRWAPEALPAAFYLHGGIGGLLGRGASVAAGAGGGLEWRIESLNCLGLFVDCTHWFAERGADATVLSAGLRYSF